MKTKIYILIALTACIGLLLTGFSAVYAQMDTSVTLSFSGVVQQTPTLVTTPTGPYSYIISVSGSNYLMTDGTSGQIVFQSTNSSQVFSNVIVNCSVGSSIDVESGVYEVNTMWLMLNDNITVDFEIGAILVAGNNLNTAVLVLLGNNIIINGATINGNAAQQTVTWYVWTYGYMDTSGILVGGSNVQIQNAVIYNCRVCGVNIIGQYFSTPNLVHSGVVNSLIYDCGWNGINAGGSISCSDCYATNNEVYGCSDVGIAAEGTGSLIAGNYIHDMAVFIGGGHGVGEGTLWGVGLESGGGAGSVGRSNLVTNNTLFNTAYGIMAINWGNNTISKNQIINCTYSGIGLQEGTTENIVTNNNVSRLVGTLGGSEYGIILTNSSFNIISNNYVFGSNFYGMWLDSASDNNTVSLNHIFDNSFSTVSNMGCGIGLYGSRNYVSQNQVYDDRSGTARTQNYGIIIQSGAAGNIIMGNNVSNNLYMNIADLGTNTIII